MGVMLRRVPLKTWISIVTFGLVALIIYLSRDELVRAWELLFKVDTWKLLLLLPLQALSYYAAGAMVFSYLKAKYGMQVPARETAKMALELNFVNHILPSGGVSGVSYMTWRLNHLGVSAGRGTLAQVVRLTMGFVAFLVLMIVAVIVITLDGQINRVTILVSSGLASTIIFGSLGLLYIVKSRRRLEGAADFIAKYVNALWRKVSRRHSPLLRSAVVEAFFADMHDDYTQLAKNPGVLKAPFWWGIVFTIADVAMFWVTFWALGTLINPAPLLIAYGLAVMAGTFFFTPGGVGGFEALMVAFLATTGLPNSTTIAAILLTRTLLVLGTIISGYYFYQRALNKYGKHPA